MIEPPKYDRSQLYKDQFNGIAVDIINTARQEAEQVQQLAQDFAFQKSIEQINNIRDFLGSPENILGSELTKHGEIAEQVEVGIRNARSVLYGEEMKATFDGVGRTAPMDYLLDGVEIQSKFINGVNNNLNHVLEHMDKYQNFGRDGSYYHIPKDTHETIIRVMRGDDGELAKRTADAIREKVRLIEEQSGQPFESVVKPGISNYAEVQQGKVLSTLDNHQEQLEKENSNLKEQIVQDHQPSLSEALNAAAIAGAVGGTLTFATSVYAKYKQGKNPFKNQFTAEDWKDVGIDTAQGTAIGAISGGAIYWMTNYANMAAPFAAAVVSAAKGVGELVTQLDEGKINLHQFIDMGMMICAESAIVGLATVAGQTLIPIPVLGAVIGSLAGRMVAEFTASKATEIAKQIKEDMDNFLKILDSKLQGVIQTIDAEFDKLGELTVAAFDFERNKALLQSSVQLAEAYGVSKSKLITSHSELDDFMLN